mgnify:FL=1
MIKIPLTIAWFSKFVLFLLLNYFKDSGDIQKYEDFLDCRNVREKYFEKLTSIKKLRNCFKAFFVLNIITESLDKIEGLFEVLNTN